MKKMQWFLLSLMLPVFMGYAGGCKPAVGCKPLCKNRDGSLDITFGDHGTIVTDVEGRDEAARGVVALPCGRIIAAGYTNPPVGGIFYDFALAGYTPYGVLDTKFGSDGTGIVLTDFATALNNAGGDFSVPSEDFAYAIALQTNCDGCDHVCRDSCNLDCNRNCKLVVAGSTTVISNGPPQFGIARYNCDGSLDTTFGFNNSGVQGVNIGVVSIAYAVAIQEDNKIVVAGFTVTGGDVDFAVARLNCDGSLDTTFGCEGTGIIITRFSDNDGIANAVKIQKDGKIVVAGRASNGSNNSFALVRYHANGRLDRSFGPNHNGKVVTFFGATAASSDDVAQALVLVEDCDFECGCDDSLRIVVVGTTSVAVGDDATKIQIALAGYKANGCLDKSFGTAGTGLVTTTFVEGLSAGAFAAELQRGCANACKIIVAGFQQGELEGSDFLVARYDIEGLLDKEFGLNGSVITPVNNNNVVAYALAVQENGDIVVAGQADRGGFLDFALARYNQCESCECSCIKKDCLAC